MISSKQISKAVISLTNSKQNSEEVLAKLLKFTQKYHLENSLPQIFSNLKKEADKIKKENTLFVETPQNISVNTVNKIFGYVSVPEKTEVKVIKNESLIGGFRAYFKDKKIDGSVDNTLRKLKERLIEN